MKSSEQNPKEKSPLNIRYRRLFLPYALLLAATTSCGAFIYWLIIVLPELETIREGITHFWIPAFVGAIVVFFLVRPKLQMLQLKTKKADLPYLYFILAMAGISVPLSIAIHLVDELSAKTTVVENIGEIRDRPHTRYYKASSYVINQGFPGINAVADVSGKYNQYLNYTLYICSPITEHLGDSSRQPAAFVGARYHKQISNRLSDHEKEKLYEAFFESSMSDYYKGRGEPFQYLKRLPNTLEHDQYKLAARRSRLYSQEDQLLVLIPVYEPYARRASGEIRALLISFAVIPSIWAFMVFLPKLQENVARQSDQQLKRRAGRRFQKEWSLLFPGREFWATPLLAFLNIAVFILMLLAGVDGFSPLGRELWNWGALSARAFTAGEWWRMVTAFFVHAGIVHLVMNMMGLFLAGQFLEKTIGSARLLGWYLFCGLMAGFVSLAWNPEVIRVGASGAIFGLNGILLAFILLKRFDPVSNRFLLLLLAGTAGFSLVMGFLIKGIDNAAHLGGLATGLIVGYTITLVSGKQPAGVDVLGD